MTRETASKLWEVIKAYGEGKTIQFHSVNGKWIDVDFLFGEEIDDGVLEYHIKPEENYSIEQNVEEKYYHPFNSYNHLVYYYYKNVLKQKFIKDISVELPVIWIKHKTLKDRFMITSFKDIENVGDVVEAGGMNLSMNELLDNWEFLNGMPCGEEVTE